MQVQRTLTSPTKRTKLPGAWCARQQLPARQHNITLSHRVANISCFETISFLCLDNPRGICSIVYNYSPVINVILTVSDPSSLEHAWPCWVSEPFPRSCLRSFWPARGLPSSKVLGVTVCELAIFNPRCSM